MHVSNLIFLWIPCVAMRAHCGRDARKSTTGKCPIDENSRKCARVIPARHFFAFFRRVPKMKPLVIPGEHARQRV
jgi:hypothetical protein